MTLDVCSKSDQIPNPTPLKQAINAEDERHVAAHRRLSCPHYDACLDRAVAEDWTSFSCRACPLAGELAPEPQAVPLVRAPRRSRPDEIAELLRESAATWSAARIADELDFDEADVRRALTTLVEDGRAFRVALGVYAAPGAVVELPPLDPNAGRAERIAALVNSSDRHWSPREMAEALGTPEDNSDVGNELGRLCRERRIRKIRRATYGRIWG